MVAFNVSLPIIVVWYGASELPSFPFSLRPISVISSKISIHVIILALSSHLGCPVVRVGVPRFFVEGAFWPVFEGIELLSSWKMYHVFLSAKNRVIGLNFSNGLDNGILFVDLNWSIFWLR